MTFNTMSRGRHGPELKPFDHPFVMAGFMFFGEIGCLLAFRVSQCWRREGRSAAATAKAAGRHLPSWAFALPAACDVIGTSMM